MIYTMYMLTENASFLFGCSVRLWYGDPVSLTMSSAASSAPLCLLKEVRLFLKCTVFLVFICDGY
jgi:hypothetical protein